MTDIGFAREAEAFVAALVKKNGIFCLRELFTDTINNPEDNARFNKNFWKIF